jgi:hypothetical protein
MPRSGAAERVNELFLRPSEAMRVLFDVHGVPNNVDGCCPAGADAVSDLDCDPVCGNGIVESGEECDGGSLCTPGCIKTNEARLSRGRHHHRACRMQAVSLPRVHDLHAGLRGKLRRDLRLTLHEGDRLRSDQPVLTLTHSQLPDETSAESHGSGWNDGLDKLVARVEQLTKEKK